MRELFQVFESKEQFEFFGVKKGGTEEDMTSAGRLVKSTSVWEF